MKFKFTFLITALLLLGNLTTWGQTSMYTKITSTADLTDGDYLIVYEEESFIFDGSLTSLDASNNYQSVTIDNNSISISDSYAFTIASYNDGYSIKSASGKYIGKSTNANGLDDSESALKNTISFNGSNEAMIAGSGGAYLRFNTASVQDRFRYYKSSSYTAQQPVCLYKKTSTATTYPITIPTIEGGCVTASPNPAEENAEVTLTATPDEGYGLTEISASYGDPSTPLTLNGTGNTRTFTMPASDVEVEATFTAYTITVASNNEDWGIAVLENGNVIVTSAETGYRLSTTEPYTITEGTATVTQDEEEFTVVATSNCTIQINFEAIPTYTVTFDPGTGTVSPTSLTGETLDLSTLTLAPPTGWTFFGWATSEVEATQTAPTIISGTTYAPTADVTLYAVYSKNEGSSTTTDVLIASDLAANSTTYTDFSGVTKNTAVYAGNSAKTSNEAIQLRSKYSESGIISTTADGKDVSKIIVVWESETTDGKTLDVYGSNTAYSGANANVLYTANQGTKLGSIVCGTSTELIISGNYKYVGLRSHDGAMYITSISIIYEGSITTYNTNPSVLNITTTQDMPTTVTSSTDVIVSNNAVVTVNSDITVHDLTIEEGSKIIVKAGQTLAVNGTFTNTNATDLIVEDGGQLIINNSGVMATVEKEIAAWTTTNNNGWYTISSPVIAQSIESMFGAPQSRTITFDLYSYDEPSYTWLNYHNGSIAETSLAPGKGYLTANEAATTRQFIGELNNGEIAVDLSYASTYEPLKGFNFVGNPYTQDITIGSQANVSSSVATGYYNLSNGAFVASANSETIAPQEGFFVMATAADQTITFNNATSGSKDRGTDDQYISIVVSNSTHMDRAYVMFDNAIGLAKVSHMDETAPMLYIPQEGKNYAIAVMTAAKENLQELPVCFSAGEMGSYTLCIKPQNLEFTYLHLIDNLTGADIDLLTQNSYTFVAGANDYASRFKLVFNPIENESSVGENFAFVNNGNLIINGIEDGATLQFIDVQGRIVSSEIVSGSYSKALNVKSGVYVVRLIEGSKVRIQKLVVE